MLVLKQHTEMPLFSRSLQYYLKIFPLYMFIHFMQFTNHANNFLYTKCTKLSNVFTIVNTTNQYFKIAEKKVLHKSQTCMYNLSKHKKHFFLVCHSIK